MAPSPTARRAPAAAVHSRSAALVLLVMLALVWGVHWVVVKKGLEYMPPLTYAVLRLVAGLLTMVAILGVQGRIVRPPRSDVPIVISVGVAQIAAGVLIMNLALQAVPAGRSSVLLYAMPLWVALLMWLFFRVRPRRIELLGLVFGLVGVGILVNPSVIDWGVPAELLGTLGLVANSICWAGATIHIRRHHWTSNPLDLQPWMLLVALVPVSIGALVLEPGRPIRWEPATVLVLLYSGPLATAFANWASQSIVRSLGALTSAIGFLAVPVVGLASGAVFLHESLGLIDIAGCGLVLVGIAIASIMAPARTLAPALEAAGVPAGAPAE